MDHEMLIYSPNFLDLCSFKLFLKFYCNKNSYKLELHVQITF